MATNVEIFQRVIEAFNREGVDGVLPYYCGRRRGLRPGSSAGDLSGARGGQPRDRND